MLTRWINFLGVTVLALLVLPTIGTAKEVKGNIVNVETAEGELNNVTMIVKTETGENKKLQVKDQTMVASLHKDEAVTVDVDEQGEQVKKVNGEWKDKPVNELRIK